MGRAGRAWRPGGRGSGTRLRVTRARSVAARVSASATRGPAGSMSRCYARYMPRFASMTDSPPRSAQRAPASSPTRSRDIRRREDEGNRAETGNRALRGLIVSQSFCLASHAPAVNRRRPDLVVKPDDQVRRAVQVVKWFANTGQLLKTLAVFHASHFHDGRDRGFVGGLENSCRHEPGILDDLAEHLIETPNSNSFVCGIDLPHMEEYWALVH